MELAVAQLLKMVGHFVGFHIHDKQVANGVREAFSDAVLGSLRLSWGLQRCPFISRSQPSNSRPSQSSECALVVHFTIGQSTGDQSNQ